MKETSRWPHNLTTSTVVTAATLGPVGRVRRGPGTAGSLAGLAWFALFYPFPLPAYLLLGGASVYLAVLLCGEAETRLQKVDPSEVVLDEVVAVPFCFAGLHYFLWNGQTWLILLTGFVLFRIFDIAKPFGIGRLQGLPGGIGVVADDIAAALATCICLHLLAWFTPLFL